MFIEPTNTQRLSMIIALVCRLAPEEPVTLSWLRPVSLPTLRFISYSSTPPRSRSRR